MSHDHFRYDLLVQEALRDVVRQVLKHAVKDGFPGEHHAYITFATHAPGVQLSEHVRKEYPQEITIVLQHQYWNLEVTDDGFEVGLSFSNIPERLYVPFEAVTGFFDPSVQFGLKFEVEEEPEPEMGANDIEPNPASSVAPLPTKKKGRSNLRPVQSGEPQENGESSKNTEPSTQEPAGTDEASKSDEPIENKVISIDAFRKKP